MCVNVYIYIYIYIIYVEHRSQIRPFLKKSEIEQTCKNNRFENRFNASNVLKYYFNTLKTTF